MAAINIRCPGCRLSSEVDDVLLGTALSCPSCETEFTIHPGGFTSRTGRSTLGGSSGSDAGSEMFLTQVATRGDAGPAPPAGAPEVPVGERLAERFEVVEMLGKGSFGAVYRARDEVLGEELALKVVLRGDSGHAQRATEQLLHEYRIRRQISDTSHVIRGEDPRICDWRNLPLILLPMELAEGGTLRDWLRSDASSKDVEKGIRLFREAAMGVGAIHKAGLLHLDLKPENILLTGNKAKISDFGLGRFSLYAQYTDNPDQLLQQGVGTPVYMSPEQFQVARQRDIGSASDIYSLGVILYEILDGAPPFDGSLAELREKHLNVDPSPLNGDMASWWPIVIRCLAKNPGDRYPSLDALVADLERKELGTQLLVDVSCPGCGHINRNPAAMSCESCRAPLDDLFRPCQRCAKDLRLDVETCLGCGAAVGAYYLNLERRGQLEKVRNADPVAAIELLETILREGGEKDGDVQLLRDLRASQKQVSQFMRQALDADQAGEYETAMALWLGCMEIVPRHVKADAEAKRLKGLLSGLTKLEKRAREHADRADFEKSVELVDEALEIAPARDVFKKLKTEVSRRSANYATAMEKTRHLIGEKQLAAAAKEVKKAISLAPESAEAQRTLESLLGSSKTSDRLLEEIRSALDAGEFAAAEGKLRELELQRSDLEVVKELRTDLRARAKSFQVAMKTAETSLMEADLDAATRAVQRALGKCPSSQQPKRLSVDTEQRKEKAKHHAEQAEVKQRAAEFEKALAEASKAHALWARWPDLGAQVAASKKEFDAAMAASRSAADRADLDTCEAKVSEALKVCPDAEVAKKAAKEVASAKKHAEDHAGNAQKLMTEASFQGAVAAAHKASSAWSRWSDLPSKVADIEAKYGEALNMAKSALADGDLDPAAAASEDALATCPKSQAAKEVSEKVKKLRNDAEKALKSGERSQQRGLFGDAIDSIELASEAWPTWEEPKKRRAGLERTRVAFEAALVSAREHLEAGRLEKAEKATSEALQLCSDSNEAKNLRSQSEQRREKSNALIAEVESEARSARFDSAAKKLSEAQELWSTRSRATVAAHLSETRKKYEEVISEAKSLMVRHRYDEAQRACARALETCSGALEAMELGISIRREKEDYARTSESRKKLAVTTGKWAAYLAGGAAAVGLVIMLLIGFYEWTTGVFWPWAQSSWMPTLAAIVGSLGLSGVIGEGEISVGLFTGAIIATCVGALCYFAFGASLGGAYTLAMLATALLTVLFTLFSSLVK